MQKRSLTFWQSFSDGLQYLYQIATPQPKALPAPSGAQREPAALVEGVDLVRGQVVEPAAEVMD